MFFVQCYFLQRPNAISSSLIDDTAIKIAKMYERMQAIQAKFSRYAGSLGLYLIIGSY